MWSLLTWFLGTTSGQHIKFSHTAEKESTGNMGDRDTMLEVGERKSALRPNSVKEALRCSPVLRPPEKIQRVDGKDSSVSAPLGLVPGLPGGSPFVSFA